MSSEAAVGDGELVLAHHSLRLATFEERVEAAAAGGFPAIGLNVREYERLRDEGRTDAALSAVLAANGIRVAEIEAVTGWDQLEPSERSSQFETLVFAIADAFGARHVVAVGPTDRPLGAAAVEGFAALCDRAARHDLLVALEPQRSTAIADLDHAEAVLDGADRPNGGLNIDIWHHHRGGWSEERLRRVVPERVVVVQIDDGDLLQRVPDYREDTLRFRQPPGEGQFDLTGFLRALDEIGVRAPISVEVISEELERLPAVVVGARLGSASRAALAAAGVSMGGPRPARQPRSP